MKILLIEDDLKVSSFIKQGLEEQAYEVDCAFDGDTGLRLAANGGYDLTILDVILPGKNGHTVCSAIKKIFPHLPVLMLTALGTTEDKVAGLDVGADYYLVKPFKFQELLAVMRTLTRRSQLRESDTVIQIADLTVNLDSKTVTRSGKPLQLTKREFFLLELFIKNKGRVLSRAQISEYAWENSFETGSNVIDVYVNYLRNKVDKGFSPRLIHTVIGMGYVLKEGEE